MQKKQIIINAIFQSAKSTIDGGWRVSFDLPEHEALQVVEISKLKQTALHLVVVPQEEKEDEYSVYDIKLKDFNLD